MQSGIDFLSLLESESEFELFISIFLISYISFVSFVLADLPVDFANILSIVLPLLALTAFAATVFGGCFFFGSGLITGLG